MVSIVRMFNRLVCWLIDHDDHIDRVWDAKHPQGFVSFGVCKRCKRQWWMKGEIGYMGGIRFIRSNDEQ